jgi:hypothetical protein
MSSLQNVGWENPLIPLRRIITQRPTLQIHGLVAVVIYLDPVLLCTVFVDEPCPVCGDNFSND